MSNNNVWTQDMDKNNLITTSVGTVLKAVPVRPMWGVDIYMCHDVSDGRFRGYVGRVSDCKYGPLCSKYGRAVITALNIRINLQNIVAAKKINQK